MDTSPNDLHALLIDSVVDYAIFVLDRQGRVASWNPGAERIKGYTAQEIIGHHFSRFYTQEDLDTGLPERALRTAANEGRFTAEGWRLRKDGSRFWANTVIDPIIRDGQVIGFAKVTRDMTEQREAHLAILDSERRFRRLVQGVSDYAIFMLDLSGRIANWNVGAERIKGYREPEVIGRHFSIFYTEEDQAAGAPEAALEEATQSGQHQTEGWRRRKDGSRFWASTVIDAIRDDDGRLVGFAKITRDLTERREAQEQLERSRQQFFEAQKMEAVGQLTGGLAHDFNNLLTAILGSLELAQLRVTQGRGSDIARHLETAKGAASRAAALTHRLLAFARRQTLDPRPISVGTLVDGIADLIRRTVGPNIRVDTHAATAVWPALCDPNQLENAILNLCINARDAMPEGGHLAIELANESWQGAIREQELEAGEYVSISVRDTGQGMPPEVQARAFEPFYTTKPSGRGTGLGLSMVYGFARQSGGTVRIDSTPGQGTCVRIYLPHAVGAAVEDVKPAESQAPVPVASGQTILVVDDEPAVRLLITEVLTELGYTIIEAADGSTGLKILQSNVRIDLLITDLGLPGALNGRQMAEAGRASRPTLKVLLVTGFAADQATAGQPRTGTHVLMKPFSVDDLTGCIRRIMKD